MAKKKSSRKRSRKAPKRRIYPATGGMYPRATMTGIPAVEEFFNLVDEQDGLQAAIGVINQNIITLAAQLGYFFKYDEMAEHLRVRWGIQNGPWPPHSYCCC
jgi:hypothetical protein